MPRINPSVAQIALSRPIPGQSFCTHAPRSTPWQKPPQFTQIDEAMNWLLDSILEPIHAKQLFDLMQGGMSIEAIARTILFTGFTMGKWTPSLMMLMTKPLILTLIVLAHKAGLKDTPVVFPESHTKFHANKLSSFAANQMSMNQSKPEVQAAMALQPQQPQSPQTNNGFMSRT